MFELCKSSTLLYAYPLHLLLISNCFSCRVPLLFKSMDQKDGRGTRIRLSYMHRATILIELCGPFAIRISLPWNLTLNVLQVRVVVDDTGCNGNEDINFQFTGWVLFVLILFVCLEDCDAACAGFRLEIALLFNCVRFTISGKVVGAIGGKSCSLKNGGPSNVKVDLLSTSSDLVSSVLTSSSGSYLFTNIIPGVKVSRITFWLGVCIDVFHNFVVNKVLCMDN